jgi:hypothetical protein
MTLSNNSNSIIKEQFVKIVSFRILDEQDKPLHYLGRVMYSMSGIQLTLKPAEKAYLTFNLLIYTVGHINQQHYFYISLLENIQ